jgi:hypothetical protein
MADTRRAAAERCSAGNSRNGRDASRPFLFALMVRARSEPFNEVSMRFIHA